MAAGVYNLTIEQGSTWQLNLSVDSDNSGTDLDITNYTFSPKIAKSYYDESPVTMTYSITSPTTGKVKLSLTAAQTADLDPNIEYVWDCDMTSPADVTTRLLQGRATISAGL